MIASLILILSAVLFETMEPPGELWLVGETTLTAYGQWINPQEFALNVTVEYEV